MTTTLQPVEGIEFAEIDLTQLEAHPGYQRPLDSKRVDRMVQNYDDRLVGVLKVARDADGLSRYVWEGQHRHQMLLRLGIKRWVCQITDDTPQDQANLFVLEQEGRKNIRWPDRHRASAFAQKQEAVEIEQIVQSFGLKVGDRRHPDVIGAIGSLYFLYKRGGAEHVRETLDVITGSWSATVADRFENRVIRGVARFLWAYDDSKVDRGKLKLALRTEVPKQLLAAAAEGTGGTGSNNHEKFAEVLVKVYNRSANVKLRKTDIKASRRKKAAS